MITELINLAGTVTGILPNPTPQQPPGTQGVNTILNWITWGVIIGGLGGFLGGSGYLVVGSLMGREVKGVKIIGLAIIASILATSAGVIMRVFI